MENKTASNHNMVKILLYRILIFAILSLTFTVLLWQLNPAAFSDSSEIKPVVASTKGQGYIATKGIFCFSEKVVYAPCRGEIQREAEEGKRIARGEVGANLALAATDLTDDEAIMALVAPSPGLLSYKFDGLESVLTLDGIEDINLTPILAEPKAFMPRENSNFLHKGDVVYKTVDNQKRPLLGLSIATEYLDFTPTTGAEFSMEINGEKTKGTLVLSRLTPDVWEPVFELPAEDRWFQHRFVSVKLLIDIEI